MIQFENLKQYDKIYIVDFAPLTILCLDLLGVFYTVDNRPRLKVSNLEISFELEYDDVSNKLYVDKDLAYSVAVKHIVESTNKFISDMSDSYFNTYFELDDAVEKYKMLYPELFV